MYRHWDVLNSNKPDREMEFFWLTFKDSIIPFMLPHEIDNINNISNLLNQLQESGQYDEIRRYIMTHIEEIGWRIMEKKSFQAADHLKTNIKRWYKLSNEEMFREDNLFHNVFQIYNTCIYKLTKQHCDIIDYIAQYRESTDKTHTLQKIAVVCIKYNMGGCTDKLQKIFDFNVFLPNRKIKIGRTKGPKLIKLIKSEGCYAFM